MSDECALPQFGGCCCKCRYRLTDYHHCTTSPALREKKGGCVCSEVKGYICHPPEFDGRAYSGWSEHGMCEMFAARKEQDESPIAGRVEA